MPRKKAAAQFVLSEHSSSPINLVGSPDFNAPPIHFAYPEQLICELSTANNVLTALVNETDQGAARMTIGTKTYFLKQFHVHTPSEHTIENERHAFEWHFVHQTDDGQYAVIGVFMDIAQATTPAFLPLLDALHTQNTNCMVDPRALIPEDKAYWHYQGTLTTPPFDPVYWTVAQTIATITEENAALLRGALLS